MKLLRNLLTVTAIALLMASSADAQSTITALDVRSTGIFGHNANVGDPNVAGAQSHFTINGAAVGGAVTADPLNYQLTYSMLDLDGDGSANDAVTFTLSASGGGATQRTFNQGTDTGFGNLNDLTFSVTGVSGTTTNSGDTIVFDGFTGAAVGGGIFNGTNADRTAEINGIAVSVPTTGSGFVTDAEDFALTPTVLFDNSGGTNGSIVARHFDLQFSTVPATIPEPSSLALLGLAGLGLATRRRR